MAQGPSLSLKYTAVGWGRQADQNSPGLIQVLHLQRYIDNFGTRALVSMVTAATERLFLEHVK